MKVSELRMPSAKTLIISSTQYASCQRFVMKQTRRRHQSKQCDGFDELVVLSSFRSYFAFCSVFEY